MPASLKDLRSRIKSVKSTQQITKAMKLVSVAKLMRAQQSVVNARFYTSSLENLVGKVHHVLHGSSLHPLMSESQVKSAIVLVIASERGLCGGYNSHVCKKAFAEVEQLEQQGFSVSVVCVGKKSFQAFQRRRHFLRQKTESVLLNEEDYLQDSKRLLSGLVGLSLSLQKPRFYLAQNLAQSIGKLYSDGQIGRFSIIYSKFQSAMVQIPTEDQILPMVFSTTKENSEPLFEPHLDQVLDQLAPLYVASRVFQSFLDAYASENGARMTAMDSATRNAKEMERKLQITYQRARQAAITKELIEIISGAEAL